MTEAVWSGSSFLEPDSEFRALVRGLGLGLGWFCGVGARAGGRLVGLGLGLKLKHFRFSVLGLRLYCFGFIESPGLLNPETLDPRAETLNPEPKTRHPNL